MKLRDSISNAGNLFKIQYFSVLGLPFTFGAKGEKVLTLMTTGILSFSVAWAVDDQGAALVPPMSTTNINNIFK